MRWKKWLWGFAALPFIGLPLIAQEPAQPAGEAPVPASEAPAPVGGTQPAAAPAAAPTNDAPEAASTDEQRPADEKISADNNLTFPVDI
jgi:hypothetical protein